jgi:hypothetical protein
VLIATRRLYESSHSGRSASRVAIVTLGSAFENLLILMINFFSDQAEHAGNIPLKNAKQTTDGPSVSALISRSQIWHTTRTPIATPSPASEKSLTRCVV